MQNEEKGKDLFFKEKEKLCDGVKPMLADAA